MKMIKAKFKFNDPTQTSGTYYIKEEDTGTITDAFNNNKNIIFTSYWGDKFLPWGVSDSVCINMKYCIKVEMSVFYTDPEEA